MKPIPTMPSWAKVVFLSGDIVWLYREYPLIKNGIPHKRLLIILDDYVRNRYKITDKFLKFDEYSQGIYTADFPEEFYLKISDNVENPVILMLCGFFGEPILDNILSKQALKISGLKSDAVNMEDENQRLRVKIKTLMEKITVLQEGGLEKWK